MQPEAARSQVNTLLEWADLWERDDRGAEGNVEVAFLLRRAAKLASSITGLPNVKVEEPPEGVPRIIQGALREG